MHRGTNALRVGAFLPGVEPCVEPLPSFRAIGLRVVATAFTKNDDHGASLSNTSVLYSRTLVKGIKYIIPKKKPLMPPLFRGQVTRQQLPTK